MLLYVDDFLCIYKHTYLALDRLGKYFSLRTGSVGPPKIYLGSKISQVQLLNGVSSWEISASRYIQEAVKKFRMVVNPVNKPCLLYGDKQYILWNTTVPYSTWKNKACSWAYNYFRSGASENV